MERASANFKLVDTHAHLYFENFDPDRNAVIERAHQAGIVQIINIGIDLETSQQSIRLAEQHNLIFASAGIHPNESHAVEADYLPRLEKLIQHPKVVAVGEIGLDYYRDYATPKQQKEVLTSQLNLAVAHNLPVIIHTRDAWFDIFSALYPFCQQGLTGVFHCFSGTIEHAKRVLDLGFFISFTGVVTFKNASKLREIVRFVPTDRILLETDCPFMAPVPFRGKRCEPVHVIPIAEKIAEIKSTSLEDLAWQTNKNVKDLFGEKMAVV